MLFNKNREAAHSSAPERFEILEFWSRRDRDTRTLLVCSSRSVFRSHFGCFTDPKPICDLHIFEVIPCKEISELLLLGCKEKTTR